MPILNYTSKISPTVTIGEIQKNLIKHGPRKIITYFDKQGVVTAVTFHLVSICRAEWYTFLDMGKPTFILPLVSVP